MIDYNPNNLAEVVIWELAENNTLLRVVDLCTTNLGFNLFNEEYNLLYDTTNTPPELISATLASPSARILRPFKTKVLAPINSCKIRKKML